MGIDFIERRSRGRSDGGGRVGTNFSDSNGGVMASSSSLGKVVSANGNHRYLQQQQHHHNNSYHNHVVPDNTYHHNHNHTKNMVLVSEGSPKENGHYNPNQCGTVRTVATRTQVTSPSPSSAAAVVNQTTRSFLSYTSSPTLNGSRSNGGSGNNYNHHRQRNNSSSHLSAVPPATTSSSSSVGTSVTDNTCAITPAAAITTTPAKPSRTLSVRNFSNFVKRLPSLSLSPSVRIATSLGFSSTNSHNHSSNNSESTNSNNASSSSSSSAKPQGLSSSGNTATLKRPTTVSFQKKKARPFSYAEPGSLSNGHHNHHTTSSSHLHQLQKPNGISSSKKSSIINTCGSNLNSIPVTNLSPKGKLENVGNDGPTYNGHNVADLEARLAHLRVQQRERRKSLDFAISCVEPDPTCFSVEEQV